MWYQNGKFLNKKNTFSDFLDCAKHLIAENWTSPGHLVIQGASAGGLVMGNAINQAPELFAGVVCRAPFVDLIGSMSDEKLPLTVGEVGVMHVRRLELML
jgi:oligopeptidase B